MRRAILFAQTQGYFGADSFVHSLLMRGLPEHGFDVHVAADPATDAGQRMAAIPGVSLVPVRMALSLSQVGTREKVRSLPAVAAMGQELASLTTYARRNRIGVVHATEKPRDVILASAVGTATPAKSLVHLHVKCHESLGRIPMLGMRRADAIVGVSEFVRDSTVARGFAARKVHPILNAIDVDAWRPCPGARASVEAEFGIPAGSPLLLIAARIFSWKGHELLVDALARVAVQHPDARLLVVGMDDPRGDGGGDPLTVRLDAQIARLGLQDNVIFAGHRPDMARFYSACDIYTMPSFEEPFGLVYAEAMAMEKPVVALDNGGAKEVVVHGETGLLSMPGDAAGLAANITCLLENPAIREAMGRAGRARVEREFAPARLCADFARLYESLIAR